MEKSDVITGVVDGKPIIEKDPFAFMNLLSMFENPAFTVLNDKHTIMIKDGQVYVLVFLKQRNQEVFIKCKIAKTGIELLDQDNVIAASLIPEYRVSKRIHAGMGTKMYSI